MTHKLLLALIALAVLMVPVSADITVTPASVTSSSILWTWPAATLTNLSIDGMYVCGFNPTSNQFILSGLDPNEPHTITVITAGDTGSNTTTTLPNENTEKSTSIMAIFSTWGYLIVILICCVVGMMRKLGIVLIVAMVISLYALYDFITTTQVTDAPLVQLPFLIYLAFVVIPWLLAYLKGGFTK